MTSTSKLPRYVVDASVAVKWHLLDEQDVEAAEQLLRDFLGGRIRLIAPHYIRYEVPSALRKAMRTRRISKEVAQEAIESFLVWDIPTVGGDDLIFTAFDYSVRFGCSLYDGLYLALAEQSGCPVIFADLRLRNALAGRFPLALWLTDYSSVTER